MFPNLQINKCLALKEIPTRAETLPRIKENKRKVPLDSNAGKNLYEILSTTSKYIC